MNHNHKSQSISRLSQSTPLAKVYLLPFATFFVYRMNTTDGCFRLVLEFFRSGPSQHYTGRITFRIQQGLRTPRKNAFRDQLERRSKANLYIFLNSSTKSRYGSTPSNGNALGQVSRRASIVPFSRSRSIQTYRNSFNRNRQISNLLCVSRSSNFTLISQPSIYPSDH